MTIYLDACCLNRPFDDQGVERNRLEGEAVILILKRVERGEVRWASSGALLRELDRNPHEEKRERVRNLLGYATETSGVAEAQLVRAGQLVTLGFKAFDALHLACAEAAGCQVFLTTDDRLIRRARSNAGRLSVNV